MSAAATAAVLDTLPDIPCFAKVPWPRFTNPDPIMGTRRRRTCVLRNGHLAHDIPCRYEWVTEKVDVPQIDQSEAF